MATAEDASATADSTQVEEIGQTVDELTDHHGEPTQRITDLEEVEHPHLNADQPTDSSSAREFNTG